MLHRRQDDEPGRTFTAAKTQLQLNIGSTSRQLQRQVAGCVLCRSPTRKHHWIVDVLDIHRPPAANGLNDDLLHGSPSHRRRTPRPSGGRFGSSWAGVKGWFRGLGSGGAMILKANGRQRNLLKGRIEKLHRNNRRVLAGRGAAPAKIGPIRWVECADPRGHSQAALINGDDFDAYLDVRVQRSRCFLDRSDPGDRCCCDHTGSPCEPSGFSKSNLDRARRAAPPHSQLHLASNRGREPRHGVMLLSAVVLSPSN
jgi:hypothetical protein